MFSVKPSLRLKLEAAKVEAIALEHNKDENDMGIVL